MQSNGNNWTLGKIALVSAAAGIIVLLFLMWLIGFGFSGSFLWGLIVAVIVFLILWLNFGASEEAGSAAHGGAGGGHAAGSAARAATPGAAASAGAGDAKAGSGASGGTKAGGPAVAADDTGAALDDGSAGTSGGVKASKDLPVQAEPADRKGELKDEGGAGASGSGKAGSADKAAGVAAAGDAGLGEDYDKDGVREGTDEGAKPVMLSAAREGGADNLKEIKGVGPKMEQMLNEMGVYHFDQIAGWTADEVAWVDANLKGFKGRVSRDGWVDQAKILAAGGDTEFSKRVDKGGVY